MKKHHLVIAFLIIIAAMLACSPRFFLASPPPPTEEKPGDESTPTSKTIETPGPTGACIISPGSPAMPDLHSPGTAGPDLLVYLNAGGSIPKLRSTLTQNAALPAQGPGLIIDDFTGDDLDDLVVVIVEPDSPGLMPPGALFFFVCNDHRYELSYTAPILTDLYNPRIYTAQDLTGDGIPELLFSQTHCGAHTCFEQVELLRWQNTKLENCLQGKTDDLPYPTVEAIGPESDGTSQIAITATGFGSVGAGPFRPFTRFWRWNAESQSFLVSGEKQLASNYRIHVLCDADHASRFGEFIQALALYDRVIEDNNLNDWLDPETERSSLAAYSFFQKMLVYLQIEDMASAETAYNDLQALCPSIAPCAAYAEMASVFWDNYQANRDLVNACSVAKEYIAAHSAEILEPLYFGYANQFYSAEDICSINP